jgi:hypothetical protein
MESISTAIHSGHGDSCGFDQNGAAGQGSEYHVVYHLDLLSETIIKQEATHPVNVADSASLPLPHHDFRKFHSKPIPVKAWNVYVDDLIWMAQGSSNRWRYATRVLLNSLDEVPSRLD